MKIQIKLLTSEAKIPTRGSEFAAGYDLYTTDSYELEPTERYLYKTGLSLAMPKGIYGRIAPRSGLSYKSGIDVMAGVIDSDYRGELGILLLNVSDEKWKPDITKPIAQIIFEYHNESNFEVVDNLPDSKRDVGGFGHTDGKPPVTVENQTSSNILNKWQNVPHVPTTKYETIIREREKSLG